MYGKRTCYGLTQYSGMMVFTVMCLCGMAYGGTTTIDFTQGTGNLVPLASVDPLTTNAECEATITNDAAIPYVVGDGGSPVTSGGTTTATMGFTPGTDIGGDNFGFFLNNPNDDLEFIEAIVTDTGAVTLRNVFTGATDTEEHPFPGGVNATMSIEYNASTNTVTVSFAGASRTAQLNNAFIGDVTGGIQIGFISEGGPNTFREFTATGPGIPDLDSTGTCTGAEGEPSSEGEPPMEGEPGTTEGEPAPEGEAEPAPPPNVITSSGTPGLIEEGQTLTLTAPDGSNYQWFKNGSPMSDEPPRITGTNEQELLFDPVSQTDQGTYTCQYDDGTKATVTTEPFNLTVLPPGSLPAAGGLGLAGGIGLVIAGGALLLRRRR